MPWASSRQLIQNTDIWGLPWWLGLDEADCLSAPLLFLRRSLEEINKRLWHFSQYFSPRLSKPRRNGETDALQLAFHMESPAFWSRHGIREFNTGITRRDCIDVMTYCEIFNYQELRLKKKGGLEKTHLSSTAKYRSLAGEALRTTLGLHKKDTSSPLWKSQVKSFWFSLL